MSETPRPGTVYWIDHFVVGSDDLDRWVDFEQKVIGTRSWANAGPDRGPRFLAFQAITSCCHNGAMKSPEPLPLSLGLGKGLPRHGLYVRQQDVDQHVKRLDEHGVPHLDPVRTSADGDDGISIAFEDPD